jgi:hypothetical protein
MADNYCQSSTFVDVPREKIQQAEEIVAKFCREAEEDEGLYLLVEVENPAQGPVGVWIYHDEYFDPNQAEALISTLLEELDLPEPVVCAWSYTCSKPRIDEFGGGAFCAQKGYDTVWVDAAETAIQRAAELNN